MNNPSVVFFVLILIIVSSLFDSVRANTSSDSTLGFAGLKSSAFTVSGQLEFGYDQNTNNNLDHDDNEDVKSLEPSSELSLSYQYSRRFSAHVNLQFGRELEIDEEKEDRLYKSSLELDEAYLHLSKVYDVKGLIADSSLILGRFAAKDSREWLYDKSVDGFFMNFNLKKINTEVGLSWNREELIGSDLLSHNDDDPVSNLIVFAEHKPFRDIKLKFSIYGIVRNDSSEDNDSPRFLALRSRGELFDKSLGYWTDFAWARGDDDDEKIDGYGLDVGATYKLDRRLQPYVTLGYAMGSGDGDRDTDFRQTGLQGNSTKLGGITSFKYYGELLDPELSNLHIVTAGIGFYPFPEMSVDLVYHYYRQDHPLKKHRKNDLDMNPDGVNRQIGSELDLIIGFEKINNVEADLTLGYFRPGDAFGDAAEDAYIVKLGVTYKF